MGESFGDYIERKKQEEKSRKFLEGLFGKDYVEEMESAKEPSFAEQAEEIVQAVIDSKYRMGSLNPRTSHEKARLRRDIACSSGLHGSPSSKRRALRELIEKYGNFEE
jgi:hypothetical protein